MKTERIKEGSVYMAVVKGQEIKVLVDMVQLDTVLGKNVETQRGVVINAKNVVAGPLKAGVDSQR